VFELTQRQLGDPEVLTVEKVIEKFAGKYLE
jgi:hypothetical protein